MAKDPSIALLVGPISASGSGPLYRQIVDGFQRAVSEGNLKPGSPLPSFRVLAEELMVSLITVKRAYEELEREGIIYRHQGLGTFISEKGVVASREAKLNKAREMIAVATKEAAEAGLEEEAIQRLAYEAVKQTLN
ncbi:MAG: GntR family transcriptional regulator [Verrucomicrobiota bacterium]